MNTCRSRLAGLGLAALAALPGQLAAQAASPIDDLIARVIADLSDLRYDDAIRRGNEVFAFARTMRPAQEVLLRSALAAAFYPEEPEAQRPDSALAQLDVVVRLSPDHVLPVSLRWRGLDSLLDVSRARTFAIALRPRGAESLTGTEGRGTLDVVSTRPARFKLEIAAAATPSGAVAHDSTLSPGRTARLTYRAHDGRRALLATGDYELRVIATDAVGGETATARLAVRVEGTPPALAAIPTLDSTQLRPEFTRPPRVRTVLTALFYATATFTIASAARAEEPLRSSFSSDGRATFVGIAILGAAAGSFWLDKGVPDREAIAANAARRNAHRTAVAAAEADNRRRIEEYRVTVTPRGEER